MVLSHRSRAVPLVVLAALLGASPACKVPLTDINAEFIISDTPWFAAEETLFVFYELEAEQGLGDKSLVEIRYTTDDAIVAWTDLDDIAAVHTHVSVDCGPHTRCGSTSIHVPLPPRDVQLRLRYHQDGEISLDATVALNIVGRGPAYSHRSLLVYGVFGEKSRAIQWRARHRFPTIRNEAATRLGLRRRFTIEGQRYGDLQITSGVSDYLYAVDCPEGFTLLGWPAVETQERAIFNPEDLPVAASTAPSVCAVASVYDPTGVFVTNAVARKNPEVRPAFPLLRSPVRDATPIKYLLSVCDRTLSEEHLAMQRQRLLLGGISPVCVDDFVAETLRDELIELFRADIERIRAEGNDMVLSLALHHDDLALREVVEAALSATLSRELDRSTPRVAGAFLLDSFTHAVVDEDLGPRVLWCPSDIFGTDDPLDDLLDRIADAAEGEGEEKGGGSTSPASSACAILPDNLELSLGPFSMSALPIFASRELYLDFIDTYSDAQAGEMTKMTFRVPEFPPAAEHIVLGPSAVVTFFNGEAISADFDDAFSFCQSNEYGGFMFRPAGTPDPIPIEILPSWHNLTGDRTYELGIVWDFPFLLRIEYVSVGAIAVSAFSASLPFGISTNSEQDLGGSVWLSEEFSLTKTLTQCERFCDQPAFDSDGVYRVLEDFRTQYAAACYTPKFPQRGDSGFPVDP